MKKSKQKSKNIVNIGVTDAEMSGPEKQDDKGKKRGSRAPVGLKSVTLDQFDELNKKVRTLTTELQS